MLSIKNPIDLMNDVTIALHDCNIWIWLSSATPFGCFLNHHHKSTNCILFEPQGIKLPSLDPLVSAQVKKIDWPSSSSSHQCANVLTLICGFKQRSGAAIHDSSDQVKFRKFSVTLQPLTTKYPKIIWRRCSIYKRIINPASWNPIFQAIKNVVVVRSW